VTVLTVSFYLLNTPSSYQAFIMSYQEVRNFMITLYDRALLPQHI